MTIELTPAPDGEFSDASLNMQGKGPAADLSEETIAAAAAPSTRTDQYLDLRSMFKAIEPRLLGAPGSDNAVFLNVNTGQSTFRALFDCGAGCLDQMSFAEITKVDAIFFSHLHFDHVAGFDQFLRGNFDRETPIHIYGPPRTAEIIHHKLQGFLWDRVEGSSGEFVVTEIHESETKSFKMVSTDGFRSIEPVATNATADALLGDELFQMRAVTLDHGSPSIGYRFDILPTVSVDTSKLQQLGWKPGPWMRSVKDMTVDGSTLVTIGKETHTLAEVREQLLVTKPGESFGYLTDFTVSPAAAEEISRVFAGCDLLICENNYRDGDEALAKKNYHVTSAEVAELAGSAEVKVLVLFHLSDRYTVDDWRAQLADVRSKFPNTFYPEGWAKEMQT